jgi:hypothetical protein
MAAAPVISFDCSGESTQRWIERRDYSPIIPRDDRVNRPRQYYITRCVKEQIEIGARRANQRGAMFNSPSVKISPPGVVRFCTVAEL